MSFFSSLQESPAQVLRSHWIVNLLKRVNWWSLRLFSCSLVHFCLFNVTMVSVCVQLLMNTTSRWCSVRMTGACSTASGSPSSTECSPTVSREASPASQWLLVRLPANCPPHGEDGPDLCFVLCSPSSRVCVRSRCWDACMVVDGGTSFEFNDGAIATISMCEEDQLRTVVLDWLSRDQSTGHWRGL